jgi:hypothetical protein
MRRRQLGTEVKNITRARNRRRCALEGEAQSSEVKNITRMQPPHPKVLAVTS